MLRDTQPCSSRCQVLIYDCVPALCAGRPWGSLSPLATHTPPPFPLLLSPTASPPCTCQMRHGHIHTSSDACSVLKAGKSRGKQVWDSVPQMRAQGGTGGRDGGGSQRKPGRGRGRGRSVKIQPPLRRQRRSHWSENAQGTRLVKGPCKYLCYHHL